MKRDSGFSLSEYEVNDWFVAGRVDGTLQDGSCIRMLVYLVYIPCTGHQRRSYAKEMLLDSVLKAWTKENFSKEIYDQLWAELVSASKEDAKRVALKKVQSMCESGRENKFKDLCKDLKSACGEKGSVGDGVPLLDKPPGELKFNAQEKGKVWAQHFEALAKD